MSTYTTENKTKLAILFGGKSSEHEVSLVSSYGVLSNVNRDIYDVICVGITKEGKWYLFEGNIEEIKNNTWCKNPENLSTVYIDPTPGGELFTVVSPEGKVTGKIKPDVVFPVLHGAFGEDGTLQGMLSLAGVPYVGPDSTSSGICMDKAFAKQIVESTGIRQAKCVVALKSTYNADIIKEKVKALGYPVFVKPSRAGSSVGVSKVKEEKDLDAALQKAFKEDSKVLIEEFIKGRETEVAVLEEDGKLTASIAGEIDPGCEFYDYDTKYINDTASYYVPARLTDEQMNYIRYAALTVFEALGCRTLSRVDFFTCDNGEIVFNEINTLPGFTPISMYPKLFDYIGIPYSELIDRLVKSALKK